MKTIIIDFTTALYHEDCRNDGETELGWFDESGSRARLRESHLKVRQAKRDRGQLIELAKQVSGSDGPFNFCVGHPFRR